MVRPALTLLTALCCLSTAAASLSPAPDRVPLRKQPVPEDQMGAITRDQTAVFQITEETEVLLDGRPCQYKDVPPHAAIVLMEVGSNNPKAVLKIHFQTRK